MKRWMNFIMLANKKDITFIFLIPTASYAKGSDDGLNFL